MTMEAAHSLSFTCDVADLEGTDNLVMRAARLLQERFDVNKGARIHLSKKIPHGAGLGGGSSDAAATLRMLTTLWNLDISDDTLASIAAELGSDVPFFLYDGPAFATGRGTELQPVNDEWGDFILPFDLVVAVPSTRISTAQAYARIIPNENNRPDLIELVRTRDLQRWRRELVNDFERAIFDAFPEIAALKRSMYDSGAVYASMSGSGSAVYGMFDDSSVAMAASEALHATGHKVWMGRQL